MVQLDHGPDVFRRRETDALFAWRSPFPCLSPETPKACPDYWGCVQEVCAKVKIGLRNLGQQFLKFRLTGDQDPKNLWYFSPGSCARNDPRWRHDEELQVPRALKRL
jgi:hypothetical protein